MGRRPSYDLEYVAHGGAYYERRAPPPAHYSPPPHEKWFPWLVPLIFVADVAVFVYTLYENNCPETLDDPDLCLFRQYLGRFSFLPLRMNPLLGPSTSTYSIKLHTVSALNLTERRDQTFFSANSYEYPAKRLQRMGGLRLELVQHGESWRLLSCLWLHAGAIHLLANMVSLLFIGIRLEEEFGFMRIGPLYLLSGFGGSLLSCLHLLVLTNNANLVSVGASGALFGLLGAMLSELITNWTIYSNKCAALSTLLAVIALNLAVGFIPGVDSSAHIGGFLSGFLLGFILLLRPQYGYLSPQQLPPGFDKGNTTPKHKCYQYFFFVTALLLLTTGYAYGLLKLLGPATVQKLNDKRIMNLQ